MIGLARRAAAAVAKLIRYLTTAKDNETPSLTAIAAILGILIFFGLSIWAFVVRGQDFDPVLWATGFSLMMPSIAVARRIAMPANSGNDHKTEEPAA